MVHYVSGRRLGVQVKLWERVPYLSALQVCSRRGAIQIHYYLPTYRPISNLSLIYPKLLNMLSNLDLLSTFLVTIFSTLISLLTVNITPLTLVFCVYSHRRLSKNIVLCFIDQMRLEWTTAFYRLGAQTCGLATTCTTYIYENSAFVHARKDSYDQWRH